MTLTDAGPAKHPDTSSARSLVPRLRQRLPPRPNIVGVRSSLACVALLAAATFTGCGSSSKNADRDCFAVWNRHSNEANQAIVAGHFTIAAVSPWRAQGYAGQRATSPPAPRFGCGYLFHTSKRYLSVSGMWDGSAIRWGVPPTIKGWWTPKQQAVHDRANVSASGMLSRR